MTLWQDMRSPGLHDKDAIAFARAINPNATMQFVKRRRRKLPQSNCYWNVNQVVTELGGSMVLGWAITKWPSICLEAMHHAIWQKPDESLVDVTEPYPSTLGGNHSTFLKDESIQVDLQKAQCTPNRYHYLIDTVETREHAKSCARFDDIRRRVAERMEHYGYRNERQFRIARKEQPNVVEPSFSAAEVIENRNLMLELRAAEQEQAAFIPLFYELAKRAS